VSKAVGDFGKLNFGSKLKMQEAKAAGIFFDPKVKEVVASTRKELETLQGERDDAIDDFMDEHVKEKRKALAKIKKDFDLKVAFAKKKDESEEALALLETTRTKELKRVTASMAEKSTLGKSNIKEKFNELAKNKNIDTKELLKALFPNKQTE